MKVIECVPSEQMYAQQVQLAELYGVSRRTIATWVAEMYSSPKYKAGDDYIDISQNLKLIKLSSFKAHVAEKHLKWATA